MIHVTLGDPQTHRSLTVYPLLGSGAISLPYLLLGDALDAGVVRVEEVGEGTVPTLLVTNDADEPVLILDGEQLIGAKQNRMTGRSMLLPGRSRTPIPVSCMEQGRWIFRGRSFRRAETHSPGRVRRQTRAHERRTLAMGMEATPDTLSQAQGDVWTSVREMSAGLKAYSSTGALDEAQRARRVDLETLGKAFSREEGQVGLLALLGRVPVATDVVGSVEHYARLHHRLLTGYLTDALPALFRRADGRTEEEPTDPAEVKAGADAFLARVSEAERVPSPTVGLGTYSVLSTGAVGAELEHEDRMVHLSAFPEGE